VALVDLDTGCLVHMKLGSLFVEHVDREGEAEDAGRRTVRVVLLHDEEEALLGVNCNRLDIDKAGEHLLLFSFAHDVACEHTLAVGVRYPVSQTTDFSLVYQVTEVFVLWLLLNRLLCFFYFLLLLLS